MARLKPSPFHCLPAGESWGVEEGNLVVALRFISACGSVEGAAMRVGLAWLKP
jgi:hypothetical protein